MFLLFVLTETCGAGKAYQNNKPGKLFDKEGFKICRGGRIRMPPIILFKSINYKDEFLSTHRLTHWKFLLKKNYTKFRKIPGNFKE
jgi:hypothetical protein